ncbi:MAG: hypothetical protein GF311_01305 [Candidatus Lokiarchaeota archaeon]|nr:hypothetical protein [Candidatus Lokiarchaeota archaeon]
MIPINIFTADFKVESILEWKLYSKEYLERVIDVCIDYLSHKAKTLMDYDYLSKFFNYYREYLYPYIPGLENSNKKVVETEIWSDEMMNLLKQEFSSFFLIYL